MGALTTNRKRADEYCNLNSPFLSFDSPSYSNPIDSHISKKPRISWLQQSSERLNSPKSAISRLSRYPEPKPTRREVHAPCRVTNLGFLSSSNRGLKDITREGREEEGFEDMGILFSRYERRKRRALDSFRYANKGKEVIYVDSEPENANVISVDWSEGSEQGLPEANKAASKFEKLDGKMGVGSIIPGYSAEASCLTHLGHTRKGLNSYSDDLPAYKKMLETVQRKYDRVTRRLLSDINFHETKWQSILSLRHVKKPKKSKKPEEDVLREAFLPLTEEEEDEVNRALSNANRRRILVTHEDSNIEITGEILQCLRPGAWLNDEVINLYLQLLKERETREPKKFLKCHFFNTFFYKKLSGGRIGYDYKSVRRWTTQRKLGYGLIECDKIFVPIHKEIHWCLAVINKKDQKLQYLDSLRGMDDHVLRVLARYYVDEVKDKSGQDIDVSSWELEYIEDLPEQENGFDCGVFMIKYADFYSRGLGLHFGQENMPYFRRRTAKEILRLRAN